MRDEVILASPDQVGDRRVAPVGANNETGAQFTLAAVAADERR